MIGNEHKGFDLLISTVNAVIKLNALFIQIKCWKNEK